MGRDKTAITVGGVTMAERCFAALSPVASPIIVVSDTGDRVRFKACREVADLYPGAGPVGAIATGLVALGEGAHLFVACDMPFITTALLQLLVDAARDEDDAVVPRINGRPEPLCALYRQTIGPKLAQFLNSGGRAAHKAIMTISTRYVEAAELQIADPDLISFVNINTPADVDRWLHEDGRFTK